MKPPPFDYYDPRTLDEALGLYSCAEDARVLAGGQSLMPMLNMRFLAPECIIDLNRIADLRFIRRNGNDLVIGAMTTQRDMERSGELREHAPLAGEALFHVGHMQTRSRGTLGGSLCHLDPAAELPLVALALDATIHVQRVGGAREIAMADFPLSYMTPALEPGEIVTEVRLPLRTGGGGHAFEEFARRHGDFAMICIAVVIEGTADRVENAAIAVGGAGAVPVRAVQAERRLVGEKADERLLLEAARLASGVDCTADIHASSGYRKRLVEVLTRRALERAVRRAGWMA